MISRADTSLIRGNKTLFFDYEFPCGLINLLDNVKIQQLKSNNRLVCDVILNILRNTFDHLFFN